MPLGAEQRDGSIVLPKGYSVPKWNQASIGGGLWVADGTVITPEGSQHVLFMFGTTEGQREPLGSQAVDLSAAEA